MTLRDVPSTTPALLWFLRSQDSKVLSSVEKNRVPSGKNVIWYPWNPPISKTLRRPRLYYRRRPQPFSIIPKERNDATMRRSSAQLKALAREALLQHYPTAVGAYLILSLLSLIQYFFPMNINLENDILSLILSQVISLMLSLIFAIFEAGGICLILNISRKRNYSLGDLLYGFRHNPDTFILVSLVLTLIQFLCQLPASIYNYTSPVWESASATDADVLYVLGIFLLLSALGGLVSFLLTIPLLLATYLLIDDPSQSAREALSSSIQLMRGNKGRMIYLQFSFLGFWILGILSLGIALLWIQPYVNMTLVYFYRELRGELDH